MTIALKEITSLKDLRAFIRFPLSLYRNHPCYVPALFVDDYETLRRDKNPAFEDCQARYWMAYRDNVPVGRIAAILNRKHIEKWNQPYMRFSWFDFIDDPAVPEALLETVENWAREEGMEAVHGPLGFTDLDREGMLVEGFNELATLSTFYNYPYYPQHMARLGYVKDIDWMEYEISMPAEPPETIAKAAGIVAKRYGLKLLEVKKKKELLAYAPELFEILNEEYQHLYGTVPLSKKQVDLYIRQYFGFITPDFVPIVVDGNGKMIAFGITLPSLSRALQKGRGELLPFGFLHLLKALRKNDRADLYLVAIRKEYQGRGVNALLMMKMFEVFRKMGIQKIETNPELETNQAVQTQWKYFDKRQHKRRRIFIKRI
ncbi:MAG TPA: GNAT family N-acetyltransferase [Anaerolineaceae bacterium]